MGVGVEALFRVAQAHLAQQLQAALADLLLGHRAVHAQRLRQLPADAQARVQGGHRLLEDHGDVAAAQAADLLVVQVQQVLIVEQHPAADDAPGRAGNQPQQRHGGDALAGAAFADDGQDLAFLHIEADLVDRMDLVAVLLEDGVQVLHVEQGAAGNVRFHIHTPMALFTRAR